jgi:hypothetical protein
MRRGGESRRARRRALLLAVAAVAAALVAGVARAGGPLVTAVAEYDEFSGSDANANLALKRIKDAGATAFRVDLRWHQVVPAKRPDAFGEDDPNDPAYDWSTFDRKLRLLAANHLEPIAVVNYPPAWAKSDETPAKLADFKSFVHAAALRYSGSAGHGRIRYWQVWVEPNVNKFFSPQTSGGRDVAPLIYRGLVNAAADAVHSVHRDNAVIAGGLSPFTVDRGITKTIGPLRFMRELLCMSKGPKPKPTCAARVKFDIWSHHPYTSGGPTHHAILPDDVSLGDLPEMRALLQAAVKAHHVVSSQRVRFWVTEFSWDTNPPDSNAVPVLLQARWTSEALYRMWQNGISLVTWLELRDQPFTPEFPVQSGLYYRGSSLQADRPKPTLLAFRFPFVAYTRSAGVLVWGRTPTSRAAIVYLEWRRSGGWRRLATVRADRYGIFTRTVGHALPVSAWVRARLANGTAASRPFSLRQPPDRLVHPFG